MMAEANSVDDDFSTCNACNEGAEAFHAGSIVSPPLLSRFTEMHYFYLLLRTDFQIQIELVVV